MASPTQGMPIDLSSLETKDGNNLIHLLCKDRLHDAKNIKINISPVQKEAIKELLKNHLPKRDILMNLLAHGCQPHKLNKYGETPFAIQWKQCQESVPSKLPRQKSIEINQKHRELLGALSRAGAGPSKAVTREIAELTVVITRHNLTISKEKCPDPEQILRWTPMEVVLGQENNCDVQVELLQHLLKYLDNDQENPIAVIEVLKSAATMLHDRVAEHGALMEFLLAMHRLFSRKPLFHCEFLRLRLVQELLPIVAALMGNNQCGAVNEQDEDTGFSPLHIAAGWGLDKVVKELLDHPLININITSRLVPNPLMHVLFHVKKTKMWQTDLLGPYVEIIKMLTENENLDVTLTDRNGSTALSLCIKVVGDMGCRYREKHIYYSLHQHKTREVLIPLEEEQSISFLCVKNGLDKEFVNLMQDHPDLDLAWVDENGMTVLHVACKMAMYTTIKALIKKEPGLCNIPDKHGNTPLFYLISHLTPQQTLEMIQQHTDLWDFQHCNNMGERAREYYKTRAGTVFNSQIYTLVKKNTEAPSSVALKRERDLRRSQFSVRPKLINKSSLENNKPRLEIKCFVQQLFILEDIFHTLVEMKGGMVNSLDNGKAPLGYCAELGLFKELKYLLENNSEVDVNLQGRNGYTALHLASLANQVESTKLLLQTKGININVQDSEGNTALYYIAVKFLPSDAIPLLPTQQWGFKIENHSSQTAYGYYRKNANEADHRLEEQLRRRCVREDPVSITSISPTPPASRPNTTIQPIERESLAQAPPPKNRPISKAEENVWSIAKENRTFLLSNFVDSDIFFNHLIHEKIMDSETIATTFRGTQKTDREIADDLLHYLSQLGDHAFIVFLQALDLSNQEHISKRLRKLTRGMLHSADLKTRIKDLELNTEDS